MRRCTRVLRGRLAIALMVVLFAIPAARSEVILQYFNTSWKELAQKMPELAEAGYGALWLPPPTKGSSVYSVGYDCWDPFDLGGKDQCGTVRTRYGTEADLLELIETAHRFGLRVYVDTIMNHRAFAVPGYNADTPLDTYPGMLPEDFHLRVTEEGFYRKWDNVANWSDTWQIQNRNFSDLIDIAQESPDNGNFGLKEGDHIPKLRFVRHPDNPEYYCYYPTGPDTAVYVGFNSTNITREVLNDPANAWLYKEDVGAYLMRAVRWLVDRTHIDGLRLDAVKHVPDYFFGQQTGGDKDGSSAGFCGQAQEQFNLTRGFSDANHRDTVFDTETAQGHGRDDLMMFGEHLGEPPGFGGYIDAGMRLVDSQLHGFLNGNLGSPWGSLRGLEYAGGHGFSSATGVGYIKSHDDDYATRPELQYALILLRHGLPNVYTDGNYQAETLGESGGAFPRHANSAFLGQFGDTRIPNLVYIHNHFARGPQRADAWGNAVEGQIPRWGDDDVVAFERRDKREDGGMSDADGTVLFFVMNDNYAAGQYREIPTTFPVGAPLWQYATGGGQFYYTVPADGKIKVITPPGGYFAFSWRSPETSALWAGGGGSPIVIEQGGAPCGTVAYVRRDGPDGDPGFNPYGVADADPADYAYTYSVPRVTDGDSLRFTVRLDGSTANVLFKLDGGMDLNGATHALGDPRDNPPALANDIFLGYEQSTFIARQHAEKFAARDTDHNNVIGSDGAETYEVTIGAAGFSINSGLAGRDSDDYTARWLFHDPVQTNDVGEPQFSPAPELAAGSNVTLWVKMGYQNDINRMFAYYTIDGTTYPEGAGGDGIGATRTVELTFRRNVSEGGGLVSDWWSGQLPAGDLPAGTVLRYKIGAFRDGVGAPVFPGDLGAIDLKRRMMSTWRIDGFNAAAVSFRPHDDYGAARTGLDEGFHILRARAFLQRDGRASIYNTFKQTFYYDTSSPAGEIRYPTENETLGGNAYSAVVRSDRTVRRVLYNIEDDDPSNDDAATGQANGNGTNAAGRLAWIDASSVNPNASVASAYPDEWRFTYRNIPSAGSATLRVRLMELSSSTNMLLDDAAGHFTTLERHVQPDAPPQELFFLWPGSDGALVRPGWTTRVNFSKDLGDGIDDDTLRQRFLYTIDGVAQGRDLYRITRNLDGSHGQLEYELPDIYDGDPETLHHLAVTHLTAGGVTLEAHRFIRTAPTDTGPHVDIVAPPEYDSDGKAYVIVLPDVADPLPEDRQFTIRVETELDAKSVWIEFTNSVGHVEPYQTVSNRIGGVGSVVSGAYEVAGAPAALTGVVSPTAGSTTLRGGGTRFADESARGNTLSIDGYTAVITQVVSQTELRLAAPYAGPSATNRPAALQPAFDSELSAGDAVQLGGNVLAVSGILSASNLVLNAPYPGADAANVPVYRLDGNPTVSGTRKYWHFLWTDMTAGRFTFRANVNTNTADQSRVDGYALRNTTVVFREVVTNAVDDLDDDDDGLYDADEAAPATLPDRNSETWLNGEVHVAMVYGRTDPLQPDTDGDGLPDGLEAGWRNPISTEHTNPATDTDGDGYPNFIADLDPPFYNTVPDNSGLPNYVFNDSRTRRINGSMTDPNEPDTDHDGLPDGIEDANRNGWVDGDGLPLYPATGNPWDDRPTVGDWPSGKWSPAWTETDPNNADTDGDGAGDGYGEDVDFDGHIAGDTNSNRVYEAGERWAETDPLNPDTDADGLPDGWERQYAFDPLDDGVIGHTNMTTGALIATNEHGAAGNPDGDTIVVGGVTNEYTNLMEYQNGTNPRRKDTGDPPPEGGITIGPGEPIGVVNGRTCYTEFMDWSRDDLLALDEYEGAGYNNQAGDLYLAWDGWDSSRDIVAFYAHDGQDEGNGGDGKFYFRLDFHDLRAHAEEGQLDIYVVIDFNSPDSGQANLPDEVDTITHMKWEAVVAVYQSSGGAIYIDDPVNMDNTTTFGQRLSEHGVTRRDQAAANGFIDAYFNHELDAVEFAVSRQALIDAGWSGVGATNFNYQVFTTKDGTGNDPRGAGDIGGRSDIRDSIVDDWIAEDYWQAQQGHKSELYSWIKGASRPGRAKVAVVLHGNQACQPGSVVQDLVNTGEGAGYYRPLDANEVFRRPLSLHVTPTLAQAIQWAAVDPAAGQPWRDGPALNARLRRLIATNVVELMGSTYSDHILPYFTHAFNRDNEALARDTLERIYNTRIAPADAVFWTPERVLDSDTFGKILDVGYTATVLDQDTHIQNWYGRNAALTDGGYRINRIDGVRCFAINSLATDAMFRNTDGGADTTLRTLLNRKARSSTQDQVVTLFSDWDAFTDNARADAYDATLRWLANRPWTAVVTLGAILRAEVDAWGDAQGDTWGTIDRASPGTAKQGHNWLNHATNGNYDRWYLGASNEESLHDKHFAIRPGAYVPSRYGMLYTTGVLLDAWNAVQGIADTNLARLARATLHASVFETAFHNEQEHDLRRFSTGEYMYPASGSNTLAAFAVNAQAQSRMAALYTAVDEWAATAASATGPQTEARDVDLDGENEYVLRNERVFALFERSGGRLVAAWVRAPIDRVVYQVIGNPVSYAGGATEDEGDGNAVADGDGYRLVAYRTSALKDWWYNGTRSYVNDLYTFTALTNGWRIASPDANIVKSVTLPAGRSRLDVQYTVNGDLYVRQGFSPNLDDLLINGQGTLGAPVDHDGVLTLGNTNYVTTTSVELGYADGPHGAAYVADATDENLAVADFTTVPMRNQAQTQQIELHGSGAFSFSIGFRVAPSDWDGDGLPNTWEDRYGTDTNAHGAAAADLDGDRLSNLGEYLAGTDPLDPNDLLAITAIDADTNAVTIRFPTKLNRNYTIWYGSGALTSGSWYAAQAAPLPGTGDPIAWRDNGTQTTSPPLAATNRLYRIHAAIPE